MSNLHVSLSLILFAFVMKKAPGKSFASKAPFDAWCREQQPVKCAGLYSSAAFSPSTQTPSQLTSWAWNQSAFTIDVINSVCSDYWFLPYGRLFCRLKKQLKHLLEKVIFWLGVFVCLFLLPYKHPLADFGSFKLMVNSHQFKIYCCNFMSLLCWRLCWLLAGWKEMLINN